MEADHIEIMVWEIDIELFVLKARGKHMADILQIYCRGAQTQQSLISCRDHILPCSLALQEHSA